MRNATEWPAIHFIFLYCVCIKYQENFASGYWARLFLWRHRTHYGDAWRFIVGSLSYLSGKFTKNFTHTLYNQRHFVSPTVSVWWNHHVSALHQILYPFKSTILSFRYRLWSRRTQLASRWRSHIVKKDPLGYIMHVFVYVKSFQVGYKKNNKG